VHRGRGQDLQHLLQRQSEQRAMAEAAQRSGTADDRSGWRVRFRRRRERDKILSHCHTCFTLRFQNNAMAASRTVPRRRMLWILIGLSVAGSTWGQGIFTLQVGTPPSPPTSLVNHADLWRYHKGTNAPQAGWRTIADASLDLTWASGHGGIGYADNANETSLCQTLLPDMINRYTTVYLRQSFLITNTADSNLHLSLTMDWDDGFVAYLDGAEIQRALAPGAVGVEPAYTSVATGLHESSRGNSAPINPPTTYDLGPVGPACAGNAHSRNSWTQPGNG